MIENVPANFNASEYTSFGSYIPIYRHIKKEVWERIGGPDARATLTVLDSIAHHCDGYAMCFPLKLTTIKGVSHMRWENVVDGLVHLVETLGWLREIRTPMPRKRVQIDWQISPFVFHVKPERIEEALELWQKSLLISPQLFRAEHKPEVLTREQNQTKQTRSTTSNKTRDGQKSFHEEVNIEICRAPLTNKGDEEYAMYVAKNCKTHLSVARQMILTYGRLETETAVGEIKTRTELINPGGALRKALRSMAITKSNAEARRAASNSAD